MLSNEELIETKIRMLVAAEVASHIVQQKEGEPLSISADKYDIVMEAMSKLDSDVRTVLSELDVVRGYILGSFNLLEQEPSHGCDANVGAVEPSEGERGSQGKRADAAEAGGTAGSSGPDGKDGGRPKPRRNSKRSRANKKSVG